MDANRVEVNGKLNAKTWNVKLTHELSKQDKLEATVDSKDVQKPTLAYSRTQDGVTLAQFNDAGGTQTPVRGDTPSPLARTTRLRDHRHADAERRHGDDPRA